MFFLVLQLFLLHSSNAQPYKCRSEYNPSDYRRHSGVPLDCNVESLGCQPSWKSGIPEGSEASQPTIYTKFLSCQERFSLCGYVYVDYETGNAKDGVHIAAGVNLGKLSNSSLSSLSTMLRSKLQPYLGLKGNLAACAVLEMPLNISQAEAKSLTDLLVNETIYNISKRYDAEKSSTSLVFFSLPRGIRTAIVSVSYQLGSPEAFNNLWQFVTKNDWDNVVKNLRNFYSNHNEQSRRDLVRRNNEADIIEATLSKCNSSVDLVFLLDESGSVSRGNFQKSLDFVLNIIKSFPDERLSGEGGSRFGLSTFSTPPYISHFHLNDYTTQSEYRTAIESVKYNSGWTYLGDALQNILTDQFTENRGLRPAVKGVPRILIILTDGKATDSVLTPAKNIRDNEISIYAVGVGGYDIDELKEIASSDKHVFTLDTFAQLKAIVSTITSSTCYKPRAAAKNETIMTNVEKGSFKYFDYKVNLGFHLQINVKDLVGNTIVYASRTTPHPYEYNHDYKFNLAAQPNKILVIPVNADFTPERLVKRSADDDLRTIYVSVTSVSDVAEFSIQASECDPSNCSEGTNEIQTTTAQVLTATPSIVSSITISMSPTSSFTIPTTSFNITLSVTSHSPTSSFTIPTTSFNTTLSVTSHSPTSFFTIPTTSFNTTLSVTSHSPTSSFTIPTTSFNTTLSVTSHSPTSSFTIPTTLFNTTLSVTSHFTSICLITDFRRPPCNSSSRVAYTHQLMVAVFLSFLIIFVQRN
ncbi:uncharacterized protein LOC124443411 [Xenia sp. Carnegie-2017]|uniref:uncharacterized protein LOC124443411 n=1 Tax=Xenia sp. Carnegie-2017 TaxID=2897299 RepID=UPI001F03FBDA|nr:uncharacterized protein LOC124443411 [Xenia sp. Carnegie-2017]